MADVSLLAPKILKWEGTKFTDDPNDAGGATKDGVTFSEYQHYEAEHGEANVSVNELKNLSLADFTAILKADYWDKCQGDEISDQQVANVIVDFKWTSGMEAVKEIQKLLQVDDTGFFGPLTLQAVNNADAATLCNAIVDARIKFYELITTQHPNWLRYKQGWTNRANDYRFKSPPGI